jgi:GT2 family glycosyltransferase
MRFSICLLQPEGYKYAHFLYDVCKYLCYTIEAAGYECCMIRNRLYSDRINLIMGAHRLTDPSSIEQIKQAGKYIIIQSEVLREGGIAGWQDQKTFDTIYIPLLRQAHAVWDSLEANQIHLQKLGIVPERRLTTFGYLKAMEEITHKKNKDIDFLYYGSLTPHRKKLLDELNALGGKVVCIFDDAAIFRNDLIARSRVNLAPNQAQGINHLTSKITYLLNNRSIVVAERCCNQDWVEHCFPFTDTNKWALLCMETLNRPDLDELAYKNFEQYKKLDMVHLIQPILDKLRLELPLSSTRNTSVTDEVHNTKSAVDGGDPLLSNSAKNQAISGMTSIIILTHNCLKHTKKCVISIRKHTPEPHEIIFVDNASTDGTIKWLQGQVKENYNYRMIENLDQEGFARAFNMGIKASQEKYLLLLDSQVIVSQGWLSGMLKHMNSADDNGLVGPVSNLASGPQLIENVPYNNDLNHMQKFALDIANNNTNKVKDVIQLDGFCLLIRRSVLDLIVGFDEGYDCGSFAFDDLCMRSHILGYRNVIAKDVFVHRYDSMTLKGNIQYFAEKWKDFIIVDKDGYKIQMTKEQQLKKLLEWGEDQFSLGNFHAAVKNFERILTLDRTNSQSLNNLGVIQVQLGDIISAMKTFQTALTYNPKDPDALENLVQAVAKTSRIDLIDTSLLDTLKLAQPANPDLVKLINAQQNLPI